MPAGVHKGRVIRTPAHGKWDIIKKLNLLPLERFVCHANEQNEWQNKSGVCEFVCVCASVWVTGCSERMGNKRKSSVGHFNLCRSAALC